MKSDPFLVQSSIKYTQTTSTTYPISVGGGAQGLKNLRKHANNGLQQIKEQPLPQKRKMVVPLTNHVKRLIKYCEAYLMDEAVTDSIIRGAAEVNNSGAGLMNQSIN